MPRTIFEVAFLAASLIASPTLARSDEVADCPVQWPVAAGGNGNYYEFVPAAGILWWDADTAAESRIFGGVQGHLASITSAQENDFILSMLPADPFMEVWLGGYQLHPRGPADQSWKWVTQEPFVYVNWAPGEPNDN